MGISTAVYDENRKILWGLCYRMTGNAADAEEIVQETFVRALETPPRDTSLPWLPWLTRVAVNLSRDFLRRRRRVDYVGPWLPSPVPTEAPQFPEPRVPTSESPSARYDMQESVSVAFLLALEVLSPAQRATLLLRDVFDYSTAEAAEKLGMTEANIKVTLCRARRKMRGYDQERIALSVTGHKSMCEALQRFIQCLVGADVTGLESLLTEDVVVLSDGGGEVTALLAPMHGRDRVLKLITQLYELQRQVTEVSACVLNYQPAILVERSQVRPGHATRYTLQLELDPSGRIRRLLFVFAPRKLQAIKE